MDTLSAGSNYGSFALQTGSALHETGDTFDFVLASNRDVRRTLEERHGHR